MTQTNAPAASGKPKTTAPAKPAGATQAAPKPPGAPKAAGTPATKPPANGAPAKPVVKPVAKPVAKVEVVEQDPMFDDLGYLDEIIEERKAEDRDRGSSRIIYLRPNREQESRSTVVRPAFNPKNSFGQDQALIPFTLHERLDSLIPGANRLLFPHLRAGCRTSLCIEPRANRRARKPMFCPICIRVQALLAFNKKLQAESKRSHDSRIKRFARAFGTWVNGAKASDWMTFCAFQKINPKTASDGMKKMLVKLTERADGKYDFAGSEDLVKATISPLMVVREKAFYIQPVVDKIAEKKGMKEEWEEQLGREVSEQEWQQKGPRLRPNPFDWKEGWTMKIKVSGKQLEMEFEVEPSTSTSPHTKGEIFLLRQDYPDIISDLVIPGTQGRVLDLRGWTKKNPGKPQADYPEYLGGLSEALKTFLRMSEEDAGAARISPKVKVFLSEASNDLDDDLDSFDKDDAEAPAAEGGGEEEGVPF